MKYVGLHIHSHKSNISSPDVVITEKHLVNRAKELGMKSLALTDHGNNIGKFAFQEECNKAGIKAIHGLEGYFVEDITSESTKTISIRGKQTESTTLDDSNGHILFLAKNKQGLEEINQLMSDSFEFGFYRKPRCDKQMVAKYLNPENVIISTACCGGFLAHMDESIINFFTPFINKNSFFIEVQAHNNDFQKQYMSKILAIANKYNLPLLATTDSHAIDTKTVSLRNAYIKSKGIIYEEEEGGWYVDMPSGEELLMRFREQQVLTEDQITQSIQNTIVVDSMCEDYNILDYGLKIPVINEMKKYSLTERNKILKDLIYQKAYTYQKSQGLSDIQFEKYISAIENELNEVFKCDSGDYFYTSYRIVKLAIEKYNGVLTATSRGSSSCFIINFFLGFTQMDKFIFDKLPLFSERFLTAERILDAKTPPDKPMLLTA